MDPKQILSNKLLKHLKIVRDKLVDQSLRNRLISTNLNSTRSKNIRFLMAITVKYLIHYLSINMKCLLAHPMMPQTLI